jgi:hypothetical protein
MSGASSTDGRGEKCIHILVGKPERKRPLERPKHGWKISD